MPKLKFVWLALLLAYLSLILFQGYHSLTDIGITFIMVAPISAVIIILSKRFSALSQHR